MQTENNCRIRTVNGKKEIFDPVRCRFVALTQEEIVRQAYLNYLIEIIHIPKIAISVEKKIVYNSLVKRYDIVVSNPDGSILLVVECKADSINMNENTLAQIAVYNHILQATYIVLFNGERQYVYQNTTKGYALIPELPCYEEIIRQKKL